MNIPWQTLLAVGIGGFFGAIARVYAIHITNKYIPLEFPLGVLIVNIIGSFTIGVLFALFTYYNFTEFSKSFLTTGFLGALTTYSTFAIESFFLFQNSILFGTLNVVLNVFGTILAAAGGYKLLHIFLR